MCATVSVGQWAWHVHHDKLVEPLSEPIEVRQAYIRTNKPAEELPTRQRLLRVVQDQATLTTAREVFEAATRPAWEAYSAAERPAREAYEAAINALHLRECPDCPWDAQRKTLFPERR